MFRVVKALQNESEFSLEGIRLLDRHKMVMQRWANYLFNRINRLDDGERESGFSFSRLMIMNCE